MLFRDFGNFKLRLLNFYQMKWRDYFFWVLVLLGALLFIRSCGEGCRIFSSKPIIKRDTTVVIKYIQQKKDTQYVPEIVGVQNTIHVPYAVHDTLEISEVKILPTDTAAILQRYYQKAFYADTQRVGNYGYVLIQDTVTQNRISARHFISNLTIPEKTTTITVYKPRTILYLGVQATGTSQMPLYTIGGDLSIKLKSDYQFGIGAAVNKEGTIFYSGRFAMPIRLHK